MCFTIVTVSAVYCVSNICYSKRFDLIKCGFQAGAILFVCTIVSAMLENQLKIGEVGAYLLIALLTSVLTGIIALGVIPLIEKMFKIVTPYGLIELADHNQTLHQTFNIRRPEHITIL